MKNRAGFTVMELMVVIAIIAVISTISIPNMIRWRTNHQLTKSLREIQSAIQSMRLESIKGNTFAQITFSPSPANSYQTRVWNWGGAAAQAVVRTHKLPGGVNITSANIAGGQVLRYNPRGLPNGAGSVILQNKPGISRRIIITMTGNSRISS